MLRFPEHKLRLFRRIRRILRAANKNVRHAAGFLRIPVSNRNDHKITDCKRQAACQIGALRLHIKSKTFSLEVADMKIAFYCRVDGQGFGFVLPDEADKLREFFAEHQDKPALEKPSSAN